MQNCSGVVYGCTRYVFGRHIFHISGNVIIQNARSLTFKAVQRRAAFEQLLTLLIEGPWRVELQLCVLSFRLGICVDTRPESEFEQRLQRHAFVRVQPRILELSMNVELRIDDSVEWRALCDVAVRSLFASVTHNGVVTVRVTFEQYEWPHDETLGLLVRQLRTLFEFACASGSCLPEPANI